MIQFSSWWSSSPPTPAAYDPTDPKQNPLNPQGLKSYARYINLLYSVQAHDESFLVATDAALVRRQNPPEMTAS